MRCQLDGKLSTTTFEASATVAAGVFSEAQLQHGSKKNWNCPPGQFDCGSSPTRPVGAFSPDVFVNTEAVLAIGLRLVEARRL